jgi:hypothetical protein
VVLGGGPAKFQRAGGRGRPGAGGGQPGGSPRLDLRLGWGRGVAGGSHGGAMRRPSPKLVLRLSCSAGRATSGSGGCGGSSWWRWCAQTAGDGSILGGHRGGGHGHDSALRHAHAGGRRGIIYRARRRKEGAFTLPRRHDARGVWPARLPRRQCHGDACGAAG